MISDVIDILFFALTAIFCKQVHISIVIIVLKLRENLGLSNNNISYINSIAGFIATLIILSAFLFQIGVFNFTYIKCALTNCPAEMTPAEKQALNNAIRQLRGEIRNLKRSSQPSQNQNTIDEFNRRLSILEQKRDNIDGNQSFHHEFVCIWGKKC